MAYKFEADFGTVKVVRRDDYKWGVIDSAGNEIVPFGKYGWIDGFDSGLCRVCGHGKMKYTGNTIAIISSNGVIQDKDEIRDKVEEDFRNHWDEFAKWGIINERGEEVLPVEYDEVWKFYGKGKFSTRVVKDGVTREVYFHELNPALSIRTNARRYAQRESIYEAHYKEYAGSYAQDVMGYSDEVISDAFEGDPDAYWNID